MKAYHMSETLRFGNILEIDHQKLAGFAQPFVQALERSEDCYYGMVLNGKYLYTVLGKFGLREWSNYAKWSTEGAFEFIRMTEFSHAISRLKCNYFYDNLKNVRQLFEYDWGQESEETQSKIHLFEVTLDDTAVQRYDMSLYDEAYNAMEKDQNVKQVLTCARRYFAGESTADPVWEILSDENVKIVADITERLLPVYRRG